MCYSRSERHRWGGRFRSGWFLVVFNLDSMSCASACLFVRTIANKMTLLSTFKASAHLSVLLTFFVVCSLADDSGSIHSIVILRGKAWSRRCTISWSAPVLIVGSRIVTSRVTPDPSRSLSLSLSLSMVIERSVFRMK